ncbi:putative trans-sialidase, Group V [Trypanosoma cruzi]|uniref:Trans-sialidase, putative n=2 Tax=Trypanosoma cruzi TaxID=5693 RepID=Q4D1D2_TRYCC|nr:trans-sialidase, putative [Trypanosoma cruzi]EAN86331.1 trans-sialidase, putative [Trypanosoma cruzi]PWV03464.1 putative trans-sialidase, Group V [Trypanosoma cruzi]RNC34504.1 putative trans-sialidase [Trypanosoma cruzi]|eukprot:XP_808182.1 trans-sialidase [Trypanosoma cruzi strain CL Brener]
MLSRAAAVKAPRTHNRRGVTGSSGRRREGGESEPQRPNMSRRVFASAVLLLLVVMMCCGSGVAALAEESNPVTAPNFEWKDVTDVDVALDSLSAPGLLKVGSDVFAVAEAQYKKDENTFTGIASQLLTMETDNTPVEIMNGAKRDTQVLEEGTTPKNKKVDVSRPTTVVKGKDIYMLVGKYSRTDAADAQERGAGDSGLLLVEVKVNSVEENNKKIDWKGTESSPQRIDTQSDSWTKLIGSGGSGVKMNDDTLVFPVEGTKKGESNDGKTVSLLIYTLKDTTKSWKLSKEVPYDGCSDPSVVEWKKKDKKLMMMTACDDGRRRVYESGDMGDSWTEALGTLSRVWGNKHGQEAKGVRSGFITATIDDDDNNRNVMLVTLPVYSEEKDKKDNGKGKLHLWLTDNTHIVDIGPVSDDDAAASSLLYKSARSGTNKKEKELIALYEKDGEKPSHSLWSVRLTAQLQRVKDVLSTWKKVDDIVSKLCPSESAAKDRPTDNACSAVIPTDGLVGFLSGNFSGNTWRDEYLGVNATVTNKDGDAGETKATKTSEGVKFKGAWAEWPVGEQGENQPYHFANYNFTLVATVSIDGVPKGNTPIPVMGVKMNGDEKTVLFGLSHENGGKWKLLCGGGTDTEDQSVNLATETKNHVVILIRNGTQGSAYVDGKSVGGNAQFDLKDIERSRGISHFYIGGDGDGAEGEEGFSVTVSNVLLYNRPLDDDEIAGLDKNKITNPKREGPKTSTTSPRSPAVSGSDVQGTVSQSSSAGQLQSEQGQQKWSNGAGAGGASTPATSTAAASSGQEPVNQPTSGTSSSGNKNVDGTPLSGGDKAVTAGSGETVQGDGSLQTPEVSVSSDEDGERAEGTDVQQEGIHSQDRELNATALSSRLGNVSQGNNTDAGSVRGSGLLPSLLLLLGMWVFAAL